MIPVAVNLSTRCLLDPQLPDDVGALLSAHGLAGSELDLEITESAIMADPERAQEILTRLVGARRRHRDRRLRHRLLVDGPPEAAADPADQDRQVVRHRSGRQPNDAAIVRSMVDLARGLGLGSRRGGRRDRRDLDSTATTSAAPAPRASTCRARCRPTTCCRGSPPIAPARPAHSRGAGAERVRPGWSGA